MAQTAFNLFLENLPNRFKNALINSCSDLIETTKQMEESEISEAYEMGWINGDLKKAPNRGKDYYDKKFDNRSDTQVV